MSRKAGADRDDSSGGNQEDAFQTIRPGPVVELKVKGSRFLGRAFHVEDESACAAILKDVRREHHKATHHCHALRLAPPEDPLERSDDDGEPSGTGGLPILAALRGAAVLDALVVVTRYFGGVKLGKGGLARAYGEAADSALAAAEKRLVWRDAKLIVTCTYDDLGTVEAVIARLSAGIPRVERAFSKGPSIALDVRRSLLEEVRNALIEATSGRVRITSP